MITYTNKYTDKSFDIAKCRESAESGYAPAQYQLGQCYEEGANVERNLAKAFRLYWMASDNCRPAKERLNKDSYQGQLARWLKKAVNGKRCQKKYKADDFMECQSGGTKQHRINNSNIGNISELEKMRREELADMPPELLDSFIHTTILTKLHTMSSYDDEIYPSNAAFWRPLSPWRFALAKKFRGNPKGPVGIYYVNSLK